MRIAHVAAEVSPLAKSGGLGDVAGALPIAQSRLGHDVSVWMPLYREVWKSLGRLGHKTEVATPPFRVEVGGSVFEVGVLKSHLPGSSVPVYLIGSDEHFDRPQIYSPDFHGRDDGILRYGIFARACLTAMRRMWFAPDVLHAHDWHAALIPMAVAWDSPPLWEFSQAAKILTIHNLAYQGTYDPGTFRWLGLPIARFPEVEHGGAVNMLKGAIASADAITAVSPTFASEIMTPAGGFGLDWLLRHRAGDVIGIVNGIDPAEWSPTNDRKIPVRYDSRTIERKRGNRRALLALAGMRPDDEGFLVGAVGRLTSQKGFDLLLPVVWDLINSGVRFVFLGSGESDLEERIRHVTAWADGRFWSHIGFNDDLAHLIEAGADSFLMPSRFEPCGLNQLYSLAYGTPPIVRRTGGLADTVVGYDGWNGAEATGFTFDESSPSALRDTVLWAEKCYREPGVWTRLVQNGMSKDFSWKQSAEKYVAVYESVLRQRR